MQPLHLCGLRSCAGVTIQSVSVVGEDVMFLIQVTDAKK